MGFWDKVHGVDACTRRLCTSKPLSLYPCTTLPLLCLCVLCCTVLCCAVVVGDERRWVFVCSSSGQSTQENWLNPPPGHHLGQQQQHHHLPRDPLQGHSSLWWCITICCSCAHHFTIGSLQDTVQEGATLPCWLGVCSSIPLRLTHSRTSTYWQEAAAAVCRRETANWIKWLEWKEPAIIVAWGAGPVMDVPPHELV